MNRHANELPGADSLQTHARDLAEHLLMITMKHVDNCGWTRGSVSSKMQSIMVFCLLQHMLVDVAKAVPKSVKEFVSGWLELEAAEKTVAGYVLDALAASGETCLPYMFSLQLREAFICC